jgi:hypothetical protein
VASCAAARGTKARAIAAKAAARAARVFKSVRGIRNFITNP